MGSSPVTGGDAGPTPSSQHSVGSSGHGVAHGGGSAAGSGVASPAKTSVANEPGEEFPQQLWGTLLPLGTQIGLHGQFPLADPPSPHGPDQVSWPSDDSVIDTPPSP